MWEIVNGAWSMLSDLWPLCCQDDRRLHDYNVDTKVNDFLKAVKDQVGEHNRIEQNILE